MDIKVNLDHLVIAAADLPSGVEYVKQTLGVEMPYGGKHNKMGTHNHLMSLGDDGFLEVIAIDLKAKQPNRPRWYGLDDPYLRAQIQRQPQLIGWVVNTNNIKRLCEQADFPFGEIELIARGDLDWYFSLPEDGRLLAAGLVPYLMQWNTDFHPASSMADLGCRLKRLEIFHPNADWLETILEQINAHLLVTMQKLQSDQPAYMTATIETPCGVKKLSNKNTACENI